MNVTFIFIASTFFTFIIDVMKFRCMTMIINGRNMLYKYFLVKIRYNITLQYFVIYNIIIDHRQPIVKAPIIYRTFLVSLKDL